MWSKKREALARKAMLNKLFRQAVIIGKTPTIRFLLEFGPDVDAIGEELTPLSLAVLSNHLSVVILLVLRGANVNKKNVDGTTALMLAAANNERDVISEYLIKEGADVNAVSKKGQTALSLAKAGGHKETEELLVAAGAKK